MSVKAAGILLFLGAVVFFTGGFSPVNLRVFGSDDNPQRQAEYIENDHTG
jgi:hypothetical protein